MPLNRFLFVIYGVVTFRGRNIAAAVPCSSILDCERKVRKGSECVDGFCTNPYHFEGCLANHNVEHYKTRTCSSEDPQSSIEKGLCRPSSMGYNEVRISSQNWESAIFVTWILQILLSEVLDVPVTVETSIPEKNLDFYDINSSFDFGGGNDWDALRRTKEAKDCRKFKNTKEYRSCSHVIPEVWSKSYTSSIDQLMDEQVIETPGGLGALGEQFWFMRRKTVENYPSFLSYTGLRGDENRKLLATVLKRPTTWSDYCKYESKDNCETPDKYSLRTPTDEKGGMYYVENSYNGYFRETDENNCVEFPDNCTGHIVDYPCGWMSHVTQQAHHLGIGVASSGKEPGSKGYSYSEMFQIWNAANATDSDVLMVWWRPAALYQQFLGTDSEFLGVVLPPPTQSCIVHRVGAEERCLDNPVLRYGDPRGSCAEAPQSIEKIISKALYDISFDTDTPEALHSPAYETIKNFRISELQIGELFNRWFQKKYDRFGLDPRNATCEWVIANIETLRSFIPRTHPRVIVSDDDIYRQPVFGAAIVLACLALLSTLSTSITIFYQRKKAAIRYSQIEFLFLLLIGLLFVSVGSLMSALPPTNGICVTVGWLVSFGYTLELVPLIVKNAAINRLMVATQQMKRVEMKMVSLFGAVALFCVIVCVCLVTWTIVERPRKYEQFDLTGTKFDNGETIVKRSYYCGSDSDTWTFLGVGWQTLLLLCASILAFQNRKIREDLNETRYLAMMIYSQMLLVIVRVITYVRDTSLHPADVTAARSIIFSVDVLATICIYFVPKLMKKDENANKKSRDTGPLPLTTHTWAAKQSAASGGSRARRKETSKKAEPVSPLPHNSPKSSSTSESLDASRTPTPFFSLESELAVVEEEEEVSMTSKVENSDEC